MSDDDDDLKTTVARTITTAISPLPWRWDVPVAEHPSRQDLMLGRILDAADGTVCSFGEAGSVGGWGSEPTELDRELLVQAPGLLKRLVDLYDSPGDPEWRKAFKITIDQARRLL